MAPVAPAGPAQRWDAYIDPTQAQPGVTLEDIQAGQMAGGVSPMQTNQFQMRADYAAPPAEPQPSRQQQLASNAYQAWTSPGQDAPPAQQEAAPKVTNMPAQDIVGQPAPAGNAARAPKPASLLTEQSAMAAESRDAAEQARTDADVSTDMQSEYLKLQGEQEADIAQQLAARAQQQQADLEEAGRVAESRRAVKEAVATDLQTQYQKLNDDAAAVQIADRRGTGQKLMGVLAIALGGMQDQNNLVAGLKQGMNVQTHNADQAVQMINESIDRDLAIQRANLENKRESAAAKFSELGIARAAIKDVDAQEAAARATLMDKYALGLDAIKAQGMSESATTTAALAAEKLRGDSLALKAQNAEKSAEKEADRTFALQVQREQERKAAARGNRRDPMVAELVAKEQAGTITAPEMKVLLGLRGDQKKLDESKDPNARMSDGDKKLARLAAGVQPAVDDLIPYLAKDKDIPYFGVRGVGKTLGSVTPEAFTPDENIKFRNSVESLTNVMLRDESGAALPPAEIETKKKSWGIEAGSHAVSKEGLRRMLVEFNARKANGSLPPTIDEEPIDEVAP